MSDQTQDITEVSTKPSPSQETEIETSQVLIDDLMDIPPDTLTSDGPEESMEVDAQGLLEAAEAVSGDSNSKEQKELSGTTEIVAEVEGTPIVIKLDIGSQYQLEEHNVLIEAQGEHDVEVEEQEEVEIASQKSADEVIQTALRGDENDDDIEEESETEEIHLSKEENELLSEEPRDSPTIWPTDKSGVPKNAPAWAEGLTQDDINQIYQLGSLSRIEIINEVKKLYDIAYKMGVQEAKEMTRGKNNNIFATKKK